MSRSDVTSYANDLLKIPYIEFKNIDPDILKIIIETLDESFKKYPLLAKSLITIADKEFINNQLLLTYCANKYNWQRWLKIHKNCYIDPIGNIDSSTFTISYFGSTYNCYYLALCLCPVLKKFNYLDFEKFKKEDAKDHIPIKDSFLKTAIWHEVGHMLDFMMNISNSIEFHNIIKNHDIANEVSLYATLNNYELLAESFALYILKEDNILAKKIGLLIDKEYLKYSQNLFLKEKFNVQKYYGTRCLNVK